MPTTSTKWCLKAAPPYVFIASSTCKRAFPAQATHLSSSRKCLLRKSTLLGHRIGTPSSFPIVRRLWQPIICLQSPSPQGEDPPDPVDEPAKLSGSTGVPAPYYVTYTSWRNPTWLAQRPTPAPRPPERPTRPLFVLPTHNLSLKLTCTALLTALLTLATVAYVQLNHTVESAISTVTEKTLSRSVTLNRVVRLNPVTGIRLQNLALSPPPASHPTAPGITAKYADAYLSSLPRALLTRTPLRLHMRLESPTIHVSQRVVPSPLNDLPIGQWDPGIVLSDSLSTSSPPPYAILAPWVQFLQLGKLSISDADVHLHPADFQDYGHGSEEVHVNGANATATFPTISVSQDAAKPKLQLEGDFRAEVAGTPAEGGSIAVELTVNGDKLMDIQPEEVVAQLHVSGEDVRACRVASFLSLPFRADEGLCAADIDMDFLYASRSLVPEMRGGAQLNAVGLRFHPDPSTPAFHGINGKLRFDGKTLFLDGPVGDLGTLPMTVVGNIHLENGYDLNGYVRPVDVNNIIETFDVEKFVPVEGLAKGEARMTGTLEEPMVIGRAESVGNNAVFDRLPVEKANVAFEWDAIGGILKFSDISGTVKGGGSVTGQGSLYFDMTKESPFGISKDTHSPRSPKAVYWNPDADLNSVAPLLPLPIDELEIDEQAPQRLYDSMRFDFRVKDIKGGDLLKYYGGEYGGMATESIGLVRGEAILAGHAKDANCRVVWRSTTPPPTVRVSMSVPEVQLSEGSIPSSNSYPPQNPAISDRHKPSAKGKLDVAPRNGADVKRLDKQQGGERESDVVSGSMLNGNPDLNRDAVPINHEDSLEGEGNRKITEEQQTVTSEDGRAVEERRNTEEMAQKTDTGEAEESGGTRAVEQSQNVKENASGGVKSGEKEMSPVESTPKDGEQSTHVLGGGDFRGLVYLKLGDLPEARRVKVRTTVKNFDVRRAGWSDLKLRSAISHMPLLDASMDTYFKGIMSQRPILPPGTTKMPRTPRMELLGVDGALAVRKLSINNVKFDNIMNGSFSFSTSDVSLSLKDAARQQKAQLSKAEESEDDSSSVEKPDQQNLEREETEVGSALDELTFSASVKGEAGLCFRQGDSEIVGSLAKNTEGHQVVQLTSRNVAVEDFLGEDLSFSSGETLAGILNADVNLDLTDRTGDGSVGIRNPRLGPLKFSSIGGNILWRDRDLVLERGTVKYRRSEYQIDAQYSSQTSPYPEFGWEVNVSIPKANVKDLAKLIQSGNAVATAMQSPSDSVPSTRSRYPAGPMWIQKLSQSHDNSSDMTYKWEVPKNISFEEQMNWFDQYLEEERTMEKRARRVRQQPTKVELAPSIADIRGDISGKVTMKYNSRAGETSEGPSNASALQQAILDQLARTTFSFELGGVSWSVGEIPIEEVKAVGSFEHGVLEIGPFSFAGSDGFGAEARGRITSAGAVEGSAVLRRAPASLVNQYSRAPVTVTGECNGRMQIDGNLSNPRILGRMVWDDATVNRQHVRGAKTDLACINGRCLLNVDAKIGGRKFPFKKDKGTNLLEPVPWDENVIEGLKGMASRMSDKSEILVVRTTKSERREYGEPVQVLVSAPVRFYLLKYLQRQTPSSFWSEIEPVLGGSHPSDDEWILMDVDVKKYGLIFLNVVLPELGWDRGDSDIRLRVSGTLPKPVAKGRVTVSDGRVWPSTLPEPLQGLRGEIQFTENGLVSFKSISGRCGGRNVNLGGDIFFTDSHRRNVEEVAERGEPAVILTRSPSPDERRERRLRNERRAEAKSSLLKATRGLILEFGDIPVNLQNVVLSKLSGRVSVGGTVVKPAIGGALTFSDGVVFLAGGAGTPPRGTYNSRNGVDPLSEALEGNMLPAEVGARARRSMGKTEPQKKRKGKTRDRGAGDVTNGGVEADVSLNGLKLSLGRDMQMVYPFVLDIETTGSVSINGNVNKPEVEGEIKLLRGNVNVLASRMTLRREAENYLKFVKWEEAGSGDRNAKFPEPLLNATLENRELLVTISECGVSSWTDHLSLANKRGDAIAEGSWARWVQAQLEGRRSEEVIKKVLAKYVMNAMALTGKLGQMEWKVFPAIVSKTGGFGETNLRGEDIGGGVEVEVGPVSVASTRSIGGARGGVFRLAWDWLGIDLESEGKWHSAQVEVKIFGDKKKKRMEVDDVEEEERVEVRREKGVAFDERDTEVSVDGDGEDVEVDVRQEGIEKEGEEGGEVGGGEEGKDERVEGRKEGDKKVVENAEKARKESKEGNVEGVEGGVVE